jgi:hypothetical protein
VPDRKKEALGASNMASRMPEKRKRDAYADSDNAEMMSASAAACDTPGVPSTMTRAVTEAPAEAVDTIVLDCELTVELTHFDTESDVWEVDTDGGKRRRCAGGGAAVAPTAQDAVLRSISVLTLGGRNTAIRGLVLRFSDRTEIGSGLLCGTTASDLKLAVGEHVVSFQITPHNYPTSITFGLSSGRSWCSNVGVLNAHNQPGVYHYSTPVRKGSPEEVLTRLEINGDNLWMQGVVWTPLASLNVKFTSSKEPTFPTLRNLARPVAAAVMARRSQALERKYASAGDELRDRGDAQLAAMSKEARDDVRQSAQAATVRRLRAELSEAERQLATAQSKRALKLAEEARSVQGSYYSDHVKVVMDRGVERAQLRQQLAVTARQSGYGGLCANGACGAPFDPDKTPPYQRCGVPGCQSLQHECGCRVTPCGRCHLPLCERHQDQHERECQGHGRCGYCEDDDVLYIECCGTKLDYYAKSRKCFCCAVLVCKECVDICFGCDEDSDRPSRDYCGAVWCKHCRHLANLPDSPCCHNCSIHRNAWY